MPFNLTIWKINTFFLILYGEISVLIGPIPRLLVTGALYNENMNLEMTMKKLGSIYKLRVGRATGNEHIFYLA